MVTCSVLSIAFIGVILDVFPIVLWFSFMDGYISVTISLSLDYLSPSFRDSQLTMEEDWA